MTTLPASTSRRMTPTTTLLDSLKTILTRPEPLTLTRTEFSLVLSTCSADLTSSTSIRPLSLAIISKLYPPTTSPSPTALQQLKSIFITQDADPVEALNFISAILQLSPKTIINLFTSSTSDPTFSSSFNELLQRITTKGKEAERLALLELFSLGSGQSKLVSNFIDSGVPEWLDQVLSTSSTKDQNTRIKLLAALTMTKLRLAQENHTLQSRIPPRPSPKIEPEPKFSFDDLTRIFMSSFLDTVEEKGKWSLPIDTRIETILLTCFEGLSYLTLGGSPTKARKDLIINERRFIPQLLRILPELYPKPVEKSKTTTLDYSIATLLFHLVEFPEAIDEKSDKAQIDRLKAFASARTKNTSTLVQESRESVLVRIGKLIDWGPITTIRHLCLSNSITTRRLSGKILHSLITPQKTRGVLLQAGVARLLLVLIRQSTAVKEEVEGALDPIQALAKLFITTNPTLIFPDLSLLQETSSTFTKALKKSSESNSLLMTFELLMALTNLSSCSVQPLTESIAKNASKFVMDELVIEKNKMVQQAAVELICNLVNSDHGIQFFTPFITSSRTSPSTNPDPTSTSSSSDPNSKSTSTTTLKPLFDRPPNKSNQHLDLLLLHLNSPNPKIRLASSGALSTLLTFEPLISKYFLLSSGSCLGKGQTGFVEMGFKRILGLIDPYSSVHDDDEDDEEEEQDREVREGNAKKKEKKEGKEEEEEGLRWRGLDCLTSLAKNFREYVVDVHQVIDRRVEGSVQKGLERLSLETNAESQAAKGISKEDKAKMVELVRDLKVVEKLEVCLNREKREDLRVLAREALDAFRTGLKGAEIERS